MTTTTSNKSSSPTKKASAVVTLLIITIVTSIIFAAPLSSMAQQQQQQTTTGTTGTATTAPTTAPLTPEEQRQQDRFVRITTAITQNLEQGQKQINGIVYTPRWSEPVWVQPNSLSLLFVYCLPGEFADSGQEILGGSELEVLESYSLAVTADLTGWLMIVENEHEIDRLPTAVGVICASDANDAETRVLSPQEQTEINNIIRQFITIRNTVISNITQIINIINNVTTNGTGGVITTPECPQGTVFNSTTQECESADAQNACKEPGFELENGICQKPADLSCTEGELVGRECRYLEESISPVCPPGSTEQGTGFCTDDITGEVVEPICEEAVSVLEGGNNLRTARCNLYVTLLAEASCSVGVLDEDRAICQISPESLTVTDATGQNASDSVSPLTVVPPPTNDTGGEAEPPTDTVEEEAPAADDGEAEPPTNDTGGQ
jgi:hypothetical protein